MQGASTRTRSKEPWSHGAAVPSATVTSSTPRSSIERSRDPALGVPGRRDAAAARSPRRGRRAGGEGGQQRRLAAGSGAEVEPAGVRALEGSRRQGERHELGSSSCTPARPSATAGTAPRVAAGGDDAVRRVRRRGAGQLGGRRASGRATRVTDGAALSASSSASISASPTASVSASTTQSGCENRVARSASSRVSQASRSWADTRRSTAFAKPAGPGPDLGADQVDAGADRRVGRDPHPQQLAAPEPQDVEDLGRGARERPVGAGGEDRVVGALAPDRARRELGRERRVPARQVGTCRAGAGRTRLVYASLTRTAFSTSNAARRAGSGALMCPSLVERRASMVERSRDAGQKLLGQRLRRHGEPRIGQHLAQLVDVDLTEPALLDEDAVVAAEVVDGEERSVRLDQGRLVVGVRGADHQQVLVLLAGLGVDRVVARRAGEHEAARLGVLLDEVRRAVAPRGAELDLGQRPADRVDVGDRRLPAHSSTSPPPRRSPRAQSAAGIGRLPTRLHLAEPERAGAGADHDRVLAGHHLTRRQRAVGQRDRAELEPLAGVRRPGARCRRTGTDLAVDDGRRLRPVDPGVVDGDLGRERDVVAGWGRSSSEPSAIPSSVATSSPAPPSASRSSRSPAVSSGRIGLGHQPVRRTGVELLDDPERGGAGDVVAGPDRVLHRGGAAPRGQQREVQVDPAAGRDVERRLRQQRAVRHHRAGVGGEPAQVVLEGRFAGMARASAPVPRSPRPPRRPATASAGVRGRWARPGG